MQRKLLPDVLKGAAVIFMIQVHVMELFMLPEVYEGLSGRISLFFGGVPAAPVFMSVMGYFVALSEKSDSRHFFRGLVLIGLGIILNLGLNAHLLYRIFSGEMQLDPWPYIFGADILFLAGLSLMFIAGVKLIAGKNIWVFVALTFIVPFIAGILPATRGGEGAAQYIMAFFAGKAWWSYFPFFPWAGWVLAGFSFALLEQKYGIHDHFGKYGKLPVYLLIIPVFGFLPWAYDILTVLPLYYHHGLGFFVWGLVFILVWAQLFTLLIEKAGDSGVIRYLQWLGKNVTLVYILQWLIIGNIATAIYKTQELYVFWVSWPLVLLASSMLTLFVLQVRFSKSNRL